MVLMSSPRRRSHTLDRLLQLNFNSVPTELFEMIVVDAEVVGDFVNKRFRNLALEVAGGELERQMRFPEEVDDVGQLTSRIRATLRQR